MQIEKICNKNEKFKKHQLNTTKKIREKDNKNNKYKKLNTKNMKISIRKFQLYIYTICLNILIVYVKCDWLTECGNCRCKWNSGKKTADCKNMTISMIPNNLSSELQVLDLSFNNIRIINDNAFIISDLKNLHKLFMRNCSLEKINSQSLCGLEILIEIDLSNNLIKSLPTNVFMYLVKVRSIILNNNLIEILNDGLFCNLKYLHKIELKNNRITSISTNVFINLPYLSQIFLNDNKLKFLRKETFDKLKRLTSLSLDSNPWNCTCELQSFRDFSLKNNLYTPPTSCYYPKKLRGILWTDQNQPEAFACKPKILYPSRGASINTSKENVTLVCRVHASPNTLIAWDYNKQMYSSSGGNSNYNQARVHIQLLREESNDNKKIEEEQEGNNNDDNDDDVNDVNEENNKNNINKIEKEIGRDIFISRLTIIGADKSDEGTYTCFAENPGGKDEVQMNLLVQKHNHQNLLFQNNLIIVICLMVLGLLSASIFLAMITCCIYKRFKSINQLSNNSDSEHHHHHPHSLHHHIENEKRNYVVSNSTNDSYHHHHHHSHQHQLPCHQTNFPDIKQNGNLDVGVTINNFTDIKDTNNFICENTSQGSLQEQQQTNAGLDEELYNRSSSHDQNQQQQQQQQQQFYLKQQQQQQQQSINNEIGIPKSTVDHHYSSEQLINSNGIGGDGGNGEYQPDLLPCIPQSMSLGYAVNQALSYDSQQLHPKHHYYHHHHQQQQQHNRSPYHIDDEEQQQQQQQTHRQSNFHQKDRQIVNDFQYANNYEITKDQIFNKSQHKDGIMTTSNRTGSGTLFGEEYQNYPVNDSIDTFLQYNSIDKMAITSSSMTGNSNATTLITQPTINHEQFNWQQQTINGIYDEDSTTSTASTMTTTSEMFLRRHSIVRTSPSLNFLSNYHSRRQLL